MAIVELSRAGVPAGKKGTRAIATRSIHAGKGTRPASPGVMPYRPQQCTAKTKNGERCKSKPVTGQKVCSLHGGRRGEQE